MTSRLIVGIGALVLIVVIAGIAWTQLNPVNSSGAQFTEQDVALVERGVLVATVSATGAIEPRDSFSLAFVTSGNLAELLVARGERVEPGQIIARLEGAALQLSLDQAEANLASAEAGLTKLEKGATASALALAQANLEAARRAYDALQEPAPSALAAARANYNSALAQYDKLSKPDATELAIAKADVDKAQAAVSQAQAAYDQIGGASNPFSAQTPQALQLQTATLDYQRAVNAFEAKFNPTDAQRKAALAQVQQANDALARLDATPENLAQAEAQIKQAEDALARLTPTAEDLAQSRAAVAAAKAARELAAQRLSEVNLTSRGAGIITFMDLAEGEFVQAGRPVVTVADLNQLQIILNIDETDIPRVQVGQAVLLDLDAFPGEQVEGQVTEIAPAAATTQGVVNYEVFIDILESSLPIRPGMTANANVQVARKENVLLIPTRSIRAQGSKRLVTVLDNGQPKEAEVSLGLSNDQYTEILDGLDEGAQVLTIALPTNLPPFGGSNNNRPGN